MSTSDESLFQSLKKVLQERIGNPITGTFVVSWLIVNWRVPVIILFGSIPEQDRIELISRNFAQGLISVLSVTLIYPFLLTLAYLLGMPILRAMYYSWLGRAEYQIRRGRQKIEEDLREESEYRETLRSICASMKKNLIESEDGFKKISEMAKSGLDPSTGDFYSQINDIATMNQKQLLYTTRHIEHFFSQYNGEMPVAYQFFLFKWCKTMKTLIGPSIERPKTSLPHS